MTAAILLLTTTLNATDLALAAKVRTYDSVAVSSKKKPAGFAPSAPTKIVGSRVPASSASTGTILGAAYSHLNKAEGASVIADVATPRKRRPDRYACTIGAV